MQSLAEVFVFDAVRTPFGRGKSTGKLHTQTPLRLVVTLLRELSRRYPQIEEVTDEVILGCCEQYHDQGGNLARSSALQAGYRVTTPGFMVSRFCGSGLDAVNTAAAKVMSGQADLVIAGGSGDAFAFFNLRFGRSHDFRRVVQRCKCSDPARTFR